LVDSEDVDGLVELSMEALDHGESSSSVMVAARATAEANTYEAQSELWSGFMQGFVELQR